MFNLQCSVSFKQVAKVTKKVYIVVYSRCKIHFFRKKLCFVIFFCTFAAFFTERLSNGNRKHTY